MIHASVAARTVDAGVERTAREGQFKGANPPSDHAPVWVTLDGPG